MNHLASSVCARGSVWDKGTDRKQTLFETIKPYYTLMRKYIGEPRAWGKLGVLLPLPSTGAWPGAVLPRGSGSSFSSAVGLLSKPECCQRAGFRQGMLGWGALPVSLSLGRGKHDPIRKAKSSPQPRKAKSSPQPCSMHGWGRGAPFVSPSFPLASGSCSSSLPVNGVG